MSGYWKKSSSIRRRTVVLSLACSGLLLLFLFHDHMLQSQDKPIPVPVTPPQSPSPGSLLPGQHQHQRQYHVSPHLQLYYHEDDADITSVDLSSPRAPFIAWPLRRVCAETTYVPGLTFVCDNNSGGPGNIRNYILTCVRYAIDAGATGLVLPRIRARSPDDASNLFRNHRPFGYMFDEPHFRAALAAACPRVAVFSTLDDVPGARDPDLAAVREGRPGARGAERLVERVTPKDFGGRRAGCDARDPNRHTDRFGPAFRAWLRETAAERGWTDTPPSGVKGKELGIPRIIRFSWGVLWDWPTHRDGPELAATFGGLLRFRADVLDIADAVAEAMRGTARRLAVPEDPDRAAASVARGRFLGVHLRSEADALARWPSYANQTQAYLGEAARRGFRGGAAYLASGDAGEAARFAREAGAALGLAVRTKFDLLDAAEEEGGGGAGVLARQLRALSWDQQALVDFAVLLQCDYFVGVSPSSFSVNVALRRHLRDEGLLARPWRVGGPGDGRSWLVGRWDRYWDDWLFMFDGMWP
ncbi:hypothetical protein GGS23DRAFT_615026 [Durotheca rogersii]|uniref:uncharacterized protein n=1 Tax=Durotheca rogersii TaxID=419775 RepID=UPI0022201BF3|nr:uncharacterized protein GGS23DRAFT_615026 [Durotheca rogersii]KAI5866544.1 hypothetical protein GGS23DRAFT_615026 [Durotheca rogersii]